ncbi:hypothetical protein [Rhodothermus marinus]|uniref:DUF4382 domain-containing protein n=1 Tax=Rhodothermus marinus (strain ATCC 43812 / DSM 4252 / R-10) TaxID=518766 RepID=D0MEZ4_RHOM4|nr:hypothetical protein [Rhodothermus marinus]ACY47444.1 hypothetical protein Rmar_0543 [Rhodothermus marinus DSM 4252]
MGRCGYLIALLTGLLAGCGGTREIVMAPPRPAAPGMPDTTAVPARLSLTVAADSVLPPPFQALTLTLHPLALRRADGHRQPLPFARRTLTFSATTPRTWTLLEAAPVPPGRYDTLWIRLSDVSVRFGPNAGGTLTVETDTLALPVTLTLDPDRAHSYRLLFELRRSLQAEPDCRWRFVPRMHLEVR